MLLGDYPWVYRRNRVALRCRRGTSRVITVDRRRGSSLWLFTAARRAAAARCIVAVDMDHHCGYSLLRDVPLLRDALLPWIAGFKGVRCRGLLGSRVLFAGSAFHLRSIC
ncbi:hypothetical protein Dimus_002436 [Dionaea muscipula]